MDVPTQVSPKLVAAFADTGLTAQDFGTTEQEITTAADGSQWSDGDGTVLTKNSQDSYSIHPEGDEPAQ